MLQVKVENVNFDQTSGMGLVLLKEPKKGKVLPIWMGVFEAQATLFKLKNLSFPRPLTHDLLNNSIKILNGKIEYVLINDLRENTYYAEIHVLQRDKEIIIDCRPSDGIALALRGGAPIYISEKVFSHTWDAREFVEHQKSELYRRYLQKVKDDEIAKA